MYDDPLPKIYLIRNRETGLYWRAPKRRYGVERRSAWTDDPAKAWHSHQLDQIPRLFGDKYPGGVTPEYDIVEFGMQERGVPYDKDHDQEEECCCGHTYERHFDWAEDYIPGCKYCPCTTFRPKSEKKWPEPMSDKVWPKPEPDPTPKPELSLEEALKLEPSEPVGFTIDPDAGHPWTGDCLYEGGALRVEKPEELEPEITLLKEQGWEVWIRDEGKLRAYLFREKSLEEVLDV